MSGRRSVVALAALLVAGALSGCITVEIGSRNPTTAGAGTTATVVNVVDGDTLRVELADGTEETVRLLGVDTPEIHTRNTPTEFEDVPETDAGVDCLRDWGERASAFATDRLAGERVRLFFDEAAGRRGSFGRLLAYVHVEGSEESFNHRLLVDGYARVYDSQFAQRDRFDAAEAEARSADRGLWGACVSGDLGTTAQGNASLAVATVHPDAEGRDGENLNDEYVVLRNAGEDSLDLTGWTLADEAGHTYRFPDGFALAPGASVTVHTGAGTDDAADLYWGASGPRWNNDGDTVVVSDAEGRVVARTTYG